MKIAFALILLLVTNPAPAQSARQREAVRRAANDKVNQTAADNPPTAAIPAHKSTTPNNKVYYAADPGWRAITNQIATALNQRAPKQQQIQQLLKKMTLKHDANQPVRTEQNQVDKLYAEIKPIDQKVAELRLKQFEIEERIDKVPRVAAPAR